MVTLLDPSNELLLSSRFWITTENDAIFEMVPLSFLYHRLVHVSSLSFGSSPITFLIVNFVHYMLRYIIQSLCVIYEFFGWILVIRLLLDNCGRRCMSIIVDDQVTWRSSVTLWRVCLVQDSDLFMGLWFYRPFHGPRESGTSPVWSHTITPSLAFCINLTSNTWRLNCGIHELNLKIYILW